MTNTELFQYCFNGHKSPISIRMRWHNIKCHPDIYEYMINYFNDADDTNSSSTEILYRIMNNILVRPKCLVCGKPAKFKRFDRGYGLFCSNKCRRSKNGEQIVQEIVKATNLERYGVEYPAQNPESLQKTINTQYKKYGCVFNPQKVKETCLKKYGVEYYIVSEDAKIKRKNTLIKHYNVDVPLKNKDILEKQKKTMLEKYGYDNNFKDPKLIEKLKSKEIREQQWETKKKNGTTNTSKIEEQFAEYLTNNNYKFERNYAKDKRYPYHADFYLKEFDLFIEIQGSWTHGGHPYNALNENDQKRLLEMKSKNSSYYSSAIRSWTIRDVEKRECAKYNNLNYLEIFSCDLNECIQLFEQKLNNK